VSGSAATGATARVKPDTRGELARLREDYLARCASLKGEQDAERDQLRDDWKTRNAAFTPVQDRAAQWDWLEELGVGFPLRGGGVGSERHAAMRILTWLIAALASAGVR
jgi:hypothetical protein